MKNRTLPAIAFAVLTLIATGAAQAQVPPQQPYPQQPYPQAPVQGYPQGYPQACPQRVTPSEQELYARFMRHFSSLGLGPQQQQRIQSMVEAFSRTHPAGSPLDPAAMRQLHDEVRSVLTPQQLAMLQQERRGGGGGGMRRCR